MGISTKFLIFSFLSIFLIKISNGTLLEAYPKILEIQNGNNGTIEFVYSGNLTNNLKIKLMTSSPNNYLMLDPENFALTNSTKKITINVKSLKVTSREFVEVANCSLDSRPADVCPFDAKKVFVQVCIYHSIIISWLIEITGYIYTIAWSISFYPQIILNFQRKSVVGLNFDFLLLNIIGFTCYTVYNVMIFFDQNVQNIYIEANPRSLIPVLLNDVLFAVHALLACIVTGIQCFIYERGNQRISYVCRIWSSLLMAFAVVSLSVTLFEAINLLQFVTFLSYVKMAVTLSKYFPQAILNYKRKSTVGWSIGNILLDFTGGFMNICQMVLQASNTEDWSGFYGNPVKFGLGIVSIIFDILFIIQHYVLYKHSEDDTTYNQVETTESLSQIPTSNHSDSPTPATNGPSTKMTPQPNNPI